MVGLCVRECCLWVRSYFSSSVLHIIFRNIWMVCEMVGKWLYGCYFVDAATRICSEQHAAFLCRSHLASSPFVSSWVQVVHPYSSTNTVLPWKKSRFMLSERSNLHMINNQSIAFHAFAMITSLSVDEILLSSYGNWSTNFRSLQLKVETTDIVGLVCLADRSSCNVDPVISSHIRASGHFTSRTKHNDKKQQTERGRKKRQTRIQNSKMLESEVCGIFSTLCVFMCGYRENSAKIQNSHQKCWPIWSSSSRLDVQFPTSRSRVFFLNVRLKILASTHRLHVLGPKCVTSSLSESHS